MRKLFFIIVAVLTTVSCNYAQIKNETKKYHLAYVEYIDDYMFMEYFNSKTVYYVGKIIVNNKTGEIEYNCLSEKDCERLKSSIENYKRKNKFGYIWPLECVLFSKEKPKRERKTDKIEYWDFNKLWLLGRATKYEDKYFWVDVKTCGLPDYTRYGFYRVINTKVGEKFFREKNPAVGSEELQKAIELNYLESFYSLKE